MHLQLPCSFNEFVSNVASNQSFTSMKSLPPALVANLFCAFRPCRRQYVAFNAARFSSVALRAAASKPSNSDKTKNLPIQVIHNRLKAQKGNDGNKEVVPWANDDKSLDSGRKVPVPLKVIPKADIAPGVTLSPKERLHIEQLTRRLPPRPEQTGDW
jgi:hypothetical protein